jgi:tetratricopeptide (TPR) repeat protein
MMKKYLLLFIAFYFLSTEKSWADRHLDSLRYLANTYKVANNDTLYIKTLLDIAYLYNDIQLDSSQKFMDIAQHYLQKNDWERGQVLFHRVRGHYYFRVGLYDKALDEYFNSQKIVKNLKDLSLDASLNIRIGTLLTYLKRIPEAHRYLAEGTSIYKKMGK